MLIAVAAMGVALAAWFWPRSSVAVVSTTVVPSASEELGTWTGTYTCGQGLTGMTLDITQVGVDKVDADFEFYPVGNPAVASGRGALQGTYTSGHLSLIWQDFTWNPADYIGVDFDGSLSESGATQMISGTVVALPGGNPCTTFSVIHM